MSYSSTLAPMLGAAALALAVFGGSAMADGEPESMKDEPADESRKLAISFTAGATTDYVFRGVSQTLEEPTAQGSIDLTYGLFYAGVWASGVDFDDAPKATAEVDLYAGFKPTWNQFTFDFGVIYYAYPNSASFVDFNNEPGHLDYVEVKAGYVATFFENLTTGTTLYYSPEYSFESGEVFTSESTLAYTFPKVAIFTPSFSALLGYQTGDSDDGYSVGGDLEDEFYYWNAGLALAVEKFTFDFRYWDTDIDVVTPFGTVCVDASLCDERFVFSAKVTLP